MFIEINFYAKNCSKTKFARNKINYAACFQN